MIPSTDSSALFYDPAASGWYRFHNEFATIEVGADSLASVRTAFGEVEALVEKRGLFAFGFISYQAAPAFDAAMKVPGASSFPLLSFKLFKSAQLVPHLDADELKSLFPHEDGRPAGPVTAPVLWETITESEYARGFAAIKRSLAEGDTYQVNYTCRFSSGDENGISGKCGRLFGRPEGYYARYSAGDVDVISFSPELFFRKTGRVLLSMPMKGTAPRYADPGKDRESRGWLAGSEKNRAENLMIVDMVRNDMGRIARPGTVRVENLFGLETYGYVHQMVSSVYAETDAPVSGVMDALFPCASITGAPKIKTMEIISRLEASSRDVYTGAVGMLFPGGNGVFSVAIRTLWRQKDNRCWRYGAGGGVVWDSDVRDEWRELHMKTGVVV